MYNSHFGRLTFSTKKTKKFYHRGKEENVLSTSLFEN